VRQNQPSVGGYFKALQNFEIASIVIVTCWDRVPNIFAKSEKIGRIIANLVEHISNKQARYQHSLATRQVITPCFTAVVPPCLCPFEIDSIGTEGHSRFGIPGLHAIPMNEETVDAVAKCPIPQFFELAWTITESTIPRCKRFGSCKGAVVSMDDRGRDSIIDPTFGWHPPMLSDL